MPYIDFNAHSDSREHLPMGRNGMPVERAPSAAQVIGENQNSFLARHWVATACRCSSDDPGFSFALHCQANTAGFLNRTPVIALLDGGSIISVPASRAGEWPALKARVAAAVGDAAVPYATLRAVLPDLQELDLRAALVALLADRRIEAVGQSVPADLTAMTFRALSA